MTRQKHHYDGHFFKRVTFICKQTAQQTPPCRHKEPCTLCRFRRLPILTPRRIRKEKVKAHERKKKVPLTEGSLAASPMGCSDGGTARDAQTEGETDGTTAPPSTITGLPGARRFNPPRFGEM